MASEKLKKYLAYYQKVLKDDPENIEARLRLAAIFKELGRQQHAVEEYVTASKLLAAEGLPLEAIAACKAVLELDPTHTEVQFFLARLFAQVPEAGGISARVATPVEDIRSSGSSPRIDVRRAEPITLGKPKADAATRSVDVDAETWDPQTGETRAAGPVPVHTELGDEATDQLVDLETTRVSEDDAEYTSEYTSQARDPELVATVDLDPEEIFGSPRSREDTAIQHPRTDTQAKSFITANEPTETIELGVFDMHSLNLEEESDEVDLPDDYYELDLEDMDLISSTDLTQRAVLAVRRGDLPEIPLFSQLSVGTFMEVLQAMDLRKVSAGGPIIEPSTNHKSLFVMVRGVAVVWRTVDGEQIELDTLSEGEFFGEFRLLTGHDSGATVSARTDVELLEISESVINLVAEHDPEIWDVLWEFYNQRMKNNLLAGSDIFRPLGHDEREELAQKFALKEVLADDTFLKEGQPCEHVYLILSGEVAVERHQAGTTQPLTQLREGEFFGVVSSFREDPYTADVRALKDTTLLCLSSRDFRAVVDANAAVAQQVQKLIRKRRSLDSAFMSGITPYGEYGVAKS